MYYILVTTTAGAALDKCHIAGVNEGFRGLEAVRNGMGAQASDEVCGTLMNVLGYRFRDDIPTKLAAFERTVHDYENQSTKTSRRRYQDRSDDAGRRMKEHLIRNSVRITSRNQMREEIFEIMRTQQYIDRQPMPMQLGASPKSKGKGKDSKGKGNRQGRQGQRQGQGCKERIVQESKERRSEKVLLLPKDRPRKGRVQKATERSCRCRGETGGSVGTSKRHSSGGPVAVLTPRRETRVNVRHGHA